MSHEILLTLRPCNMQPGTNKINMPVSGSWRLMREFFDNKGLSYARLEAGIEKLACRHMEATRIMGRKVEAMESPAACRLIAATNRQNAIRGLVEAAAGL